MKSKKAQTATEYMIILAVVIIIALIAVAILGGIPGIGAGAKTRTSSAYWMSSTLGIISYANNVSGTDVMKIKNNLKNTISISWVNMSTTGSTEPSGGFNVTNTVMAPGETKTFTGTMPAVCSKAGDSWVSNIAIKYIDQDTGATYTFLGDGNKLEGTCAG